VTEETLLTTTKIPLRDERWCKGMPLDARCYEYFIKRDCLGGNVEVGIPRRYSHEPFQKLLRVVRKYFTYEERFERIHSHHIILLMHFIGRIPLNIPFFLHQNIREMENNIQAEEDQLKRKLYHVSLIKLLVVEELRQLESNWDSLFLISCIPKDQKGDLSLSMERVIPYRVEAGVEETAQEGKTSEALSLQQ
jgi:hypothetical protein